LGKGRYRLDGVPRMRERPIQDLLDALSQLGVTAYGESNNGCPPVVVQANGLHGGVVNINGDFSSQFLCPLFMASAFADRPTSNNVTGALVSRPYVTMPIALMRTFGVSVTTDASLSRFDIPAGEAYRLSYYSIEGDASAASYFFAAAAITSGAISVM